MEAHLRKDEDVLRQNRMVPAQWSEINANPNTEDVRERQQQEILDAIQRGPGLWSWAQVLNQYCRDRVVLDVGFVAHSVEVMHRAGWEHAIIRDVARSCVGVDTATEGVRTAQSWGWDARVVDVTGSESLDQRFDVIVLGDVIEHVRNLDGLFDFIDRHLDADGDLLIKTPNPRYIGHSLSCVMRPFHPVNADHTCWIGVDQIRYWAAHRTLRLEWISGMTNLDAPPLYQKLMTAGARTHRVGLWESIGALLRPTQNRE